MNSNSPTPRAQRDTEDAIFAPLDADQREHLRALLLVLLDGLAADNPACTTAEGLAAP